ncbi:putative membrane protein [Corynebacterium variabile DSM 44702]|uniref:Putative membrane protein n=2 Tax=Corynebacterium variabile TaxID=1727 RepID=G0HHD6_CORVD|nr:gephyrin-like molybdotransferase receptor GlpR [Corynebacterium variabile]AEK37416.1 putative membrane protein [Corynebacterium variabile DSM 44702]
MSSSLSSVILIGVVWLLIITTLFVRRHSPVRRTSKALSETRVVHEGGTGIERSRRRPLPAESLYHADPDADLELVEAEPEQVVIDDTRDHTRDDADDIPDAAPPLSVPPVPSVIEGDVVEYRTLDDVDTGEFAPVAAGDDDLPVDGDAGDDEIFVEPTVADAETAEDAEMDSDAESDTVAEDERDDEVADLAEVAEIVPDEPARRFTVVDEAYIRGGDIDVSVGTDDELLVVKDTAEEPDEDAAYSDDEITEDDIDYLASHQGRGIYNPVASRQLAEQRQARRRRVLLVLVAVTVLSLIGAVALSGALWIVTLAGAALTGMYLYSLRKQTLAERELQRRRLARMRRARLGVRNTDDRELGLPDRLRRPGAVVVESDDDDPEFAALEYADVTFAGYDDVQDEVYDSGYDDDYGYPGDGQPTVRVV